MPNTELRKNQLTDLGFSAGVNRSTPVESIDPLLKKTGKPRDHHERVDQQERVAKLSRLTSAGDRRKARISRLAVLGASIVTVAGGALLLLKNHEDGQDNDTPAVVEHVEDWKKAQSLLDPTNPDVAQRQAAEVAANEVLGNQVP